MSGNEFTEETLKELQAMDLQSKVLLTREKIIEFYGGYYPGMEYGSAYISFSGGKDSTVLLHIARQIYPDIPAVFSNTGLEYPEIRRFAKSHDNVEVVQPKIHFNDVITRYGYPLISKEVAEAIYYSRKIRPQSGQEKKERRGRKTSGEWTRRRTELGGTLTTNESANKGLAENAHDNAEPSANIDVRYTEKSIFNKEKWLPLARDVPVMISNYCCKKIKKDPLNMYTHITQKYPIMATMAYESRVRKQAWLRTGCNTFEGKIQSKPMSFWTEQDVLQYIVENNLDICSVYGEIVAVDGAGNEYDPRTTLLTGCKLKCTGCERTGCIYCGFGAHLEKGETRFQLLARTHPKQYEYCMGGGQWIDNPDYDPSAPKMDGPWQNWNPKKIWAPSRDGLGLRVVFDMVNKIYGKDFYRYD